MHPTDFIYLLSPFTLALTCLNLSTFFSKQFFYQMQISTENLFRILETESRVPACEVNYENLITQQSLVCASQSHNLYFLEHSP